MRHARERWLELNRERFRALEWDGGEPAAFLLHGLTAVAESWEPTVQRLAGARRIVALDQRGHGRSTHALPNPSAAALANDAVQAARAIGLDRPHLVGHSMGGRVAIVAAARHGASFRSVAVVDIGPEAWRANWVDTIAALDRADDVLEPGRLDAIIERRQFDAEVAAAFRARFEALTDGGHRVLGSREAMKAMVRAQRSRNYWAEWQRIGIPALLVRGGASEELRGTVSDEMRRRNPSARYRELAGVGHNIPLLDPGGLADSLSAWWDTAK